MRTYSHSLPPVSAYPAYSFRTSSSAFPLLSIREEVEPLLLPLVHSFKPFSSFKKRGDRKGTYSTARPRKGYFRYF